MDSANMPFSLRALERYASAKDVGIDLLLSV